MMNGSVRSSVQPQAFKEVMALWASGVTIVTTHQAGAPVGMTVSSFAGVSLQPAQVLVCVNRSAYTHDAIAQSGYFAVNLLDADHLEWGMRFAGLQPGTPDRFAGIGWTTAETGAPILPGVLGWLDCRLCHTCSGGDHTIFVGTVVASDACSAGSPLLYYHRNWRRLADQSLLVKK